MFCIVISACLSAFFALREFNTTVSWLQNDSYNYYWYFNCLTAGNGLQMCNSTLGMNSFEVVLACLAFLSDAIAGNHYLMFFFTSMIFFVSLIFFYQSLGRHALFVIPLIFLAPSFWELELNIIRNALSSSFLFLALSFYRQKNIFLVLGGLSHTSGLLYFFIEKVIKYFKARYLLCCLFILVLLPISGTDLFIAALSKIPFVNGSTIVNKLVNYSSLYEAKLSLSNIIGKVYLLVILLLYFIVKDDEHPLKLYKFLLFILIIGALLESTSVVYRVINIYVYFIFYLVAYGMRKKSKMSYFLYVLCLLWSCFIFYSKGDFYLRFIQ